MLGCWETAELARAHGDGKDSSVGGVSLGTLFEDKRIKGADKFFTQRRKRDVLTPWP